MRFGTCTRMYHQSLAVDETLYNKYSTVRIDVVQGNQEQIRTSSWRKIGLASSDELVN